MNDGMQCFPVVGRSPEIDLKKYIVRVHGRDVVDYEKIKKNDPALYQKLLKQDRETDCVADVIIETDTNKRIQP